MSEVERRSLLVIAPQNPYPPTDGGKISIYAPLIHLNKFFRIHFVFITPEPISENVMHHFDEHEILIYPQVQNTKDTVAGYLLNFFNPLPYKFSKYCNEQVLRNLKQIVIENGIKHIWCNHAHVAWYALRLKELLNVRIYLREHNIEFSLVEQVLHLQKNPLVKLLVNYQLRKTRHFEVGCWKEFDKTFFISDSDLRGASKVAGQRTSFDTIYDGFHHADAVEGQEREPSSFLFTGGLNTFQNRYNF